MAAITYPIAGGVVDSLVAAAPASGKKVYVIEKTFNLDTIKDTLGVALGKILTTDIVNLFNIPANTMILSAGIKVTTVAVGCSSTCTAKLRFGTTDITATADILTANTVAIGGATTTALPISVGASAVSCNLVFAIGGGTVTTNPTVRATLVCVDMS